MGDMQKQTVLVTGFGPFGGHDVNASWCAVKELAKMGLGDEIKLVTLEIPVIYETICEMVPELWKKYKPHLVVHVGVSGVAHELTLEQKAINTGYEKLDIQSKLPCNGCCVEGAAECIVSGIDMNQVCARVNDSTCGVYSVVSHDPGRYLCEFVYFTSLNQDKSRSSFVHVPRLNDPYTATELARGLHTAIHAMLQQLS